MNINYLYVNYNQFRSVEESGRCVFGNGCPEAHSYEELEAWNSQLNSSIQVQTMLDS